jgi:hypothetical protein
MPTALALEGFGTTVEVRWSHNLESDLAGYNVYRSLTSGGTYTKLNKVPTDRTSYYRDDGVASLTTYYYKVSAVDSSGNESNLTAPVSVITSPPYHTVFPIVMGTNTPASVAVARIYQAHEQDIVAGSDVLYVWHPDGTSPVDADGSEVTPGDFTTLGNYYAAGPSISDLDGVGGMDIVATTWHSKAVYAFDKQGQLKAGWPFTTPTESWSVPAIADLDGNGTKEVLFGINGNALYALRSDGTEWIDGDGVPSTPGIFKTFSTGNNFGTPAIADVDRNGQKDIVYGSFSGVLYAWRPNGTNLPGFPITLGSQISSSVALGFLDGVQDTVLDIVVTTSSAGKESLYVFHANGARRAGFPKGLTSRDVSRAPSPALADINGDTFVDIVAAGTDGKLYVYDRNGNLLPAFAPSGIRYSPYFSGASESSPVVADINGDTVPDIVQGDESGTLNGFSGTGAPLPGFPIELGAEVRGTPALCDCDGDGLSEIVVAGWDTKLHVWDYNFPFSPTMLPPWPQFHHDAERTGYAKGPTYVDVPEPGGDAPVAVEFARPAPSPASRGTQLQYAVPRDRAGQSLELAVFDLSGRRIRTLSRGAAVPGRFTAQWNLRDEQGAPVSRGVYFMRLALGDHHLSHKLVVMP